MTDASLPLNPKADADTVMVDEQQKSTAAEVDPPKPLHVSLKRSRCADQKDMIDVGLYDSGGDLKISFMRTLRVADNGKASESHTDVDPSRLGFCCCYAEPRDRLGVLSY